MVRILADVYLSGGRNVRLPTTPGRSVQFTGGHCAVVDNRDMPHVLQMEGARVHPRPDAMAWAAEWLASTDWIKAEVAWPEGYTVEHSNRDEWSVSTPDDSGELCLVVAPGAPTVSPPVEPVDMTDRQEWTVSPGRRISPDDLLAEPEPEESTPPKRRK